MSRGSPLGVTSSKLVRGVDIDTRGNVVYYAVQAVSAQMLRAEGSLTRDVLATWAIESPTPGIVLINVAIEGPRSPTPFHWRGGDWTKPPLDIEINPANGAVQAVQLVLHDEHVQRGTFGGEAECAVGIPLVELTDWPEDRYRDVQCGHAGTGGWACVAVAMRALLEANLLLERASKLAWAQAGTGPVLIVDHVSGTDTSRC